MNNLKKQISGLPKFKLSFKASLKIKYRLYVLIFNEKINYILDSVKIFRAPLVYKYKKAIALPLLIIFLFTSTSVYAYTSSGVTGEHPLYPLKRGIEEAKISLSLTSGSKARTYAKMAERRLREADTIAVDSKNKSNQDNNDNNLNETIKDAILNIAEAKNESNKISDTKNFVKTTQHISDSIDGNAEALKHLANTVGLNTSDRIIDTVSGALDKLENYKHETENKEKELNDERDKEGGGGEEEEEEEEKEREEEVEENEEENKYQLNKQNLNILNNLEKATEAFKKNFERGGASKDDAEKLFKKIEERLEEAKKALEKDENKNFFSKVQAAEALMNNAHYFINSENGEKEKNSEDREDDSSDLEHDDDKNNAEHDEKDEDDEKEEYD